MSEGEGRRTWLDWGVVEIDGVEVEDNLRALKLRDASIYHLRLVWPDGSKVLIEMEGEIRYADGQGEVSGAARFCDEILIRAWADPVVVHADTSSGISTLRWPRPKEGAWRETTLGRMLEEHMRGAGIETLEELAVLLGEGEEEPVFDAEFIQRACWDHWHAVGPSFFHRLGDVLGLGRDGRLELFRAWTTLGPDEERERCA